MDEKEQWKAETVTKALTKGPKRRTAFETTSGVPVERLYTPEDAAGDYEGRSDYPEQHPFTRGVQLTMYHRRFQTMWWYAGSTAAEELNKRYRYLLEQGRTGLSTAFDLPTQIGYDSDDPMARDEVGKIGVAIDSLADMEVLFQGILLDKVSSSMTISTPAAVLLVFCIIATKKQGAPASVLKGTVQNDILKEYVARGTYIFPSVPSIRLITNTLEFYSWSVSEWNTVSISSYHIRETGSTTAQEIVFTLADGIAYVEAMLEAGMDIDKFAGRLSFFFSARNNLLEEVVKHQATRRLQAKTMKERLHARKDHSMMLRFHVQTNGSTLTARQPGDSIMRMVIQTLVAVLGGTQLLYTGSHDEALALPTEDSMRIALRTQRIVAYESGVAGSIDPLSGSYYAKRVTDELQAVAEAHIEKIDAMGGAVRAVEQGYIQRKIVESSYRHQRQVGSGEQIVVGVNKFTIEEPPAKRLLYIDASMAINQVKKLQEMKATRDSVLVRQRLDALYATVEGDDNLMPCVLDCAKAYYTEGEICSELRKVLGEYRPMETL